MAKCAVCGKTFKTENGLKKHFRMIHAKEISANSQPEAMQETPVQEQEPMDEAEQRARAEAEELKASIEKVKQQNAELNERHSNLTKIIKENKKSNYINICCSACGLSLFHPDFKGNIFNVCSNEKCQVVMHRECVVNLLDNHETCPKCKAKMTQVEIPVPEIIQIYRDRLAQPDPSPDQ
nr:hypothetical protein [Candidatus Sigynarchaeota archaeon]